MAAGKRPQTTFLDLQSPDLYQVGRDRSAPEALVGQEDRVALVGLGLVGLVGRDLEAPAGRPDLVDLENPAGQEDRVGREDTNPAALVDTNPAALVDTNPAALVDTNPAALGVMADTGLADREGPANRVDLVDRVDPEDRGSLADTNRAVRGPRDRVRVARDLGQNQAHLGRAAPSLAHLRRNLPDPDLTWARLHRMRARLRAPTHPGVATHPGEATADTEGAISVGNRLRPQKRCA